MEQEGASTTEYINNSLLWEPIKEIQGPLFLSQWGDNMFIYFISIRLCLLAHICQSAATTTTISDEEAVNGVCWMLCVMRLKFFQTWNGQYLGWLQLTSAVRECKVGCPPHHQAQSCFITQWCCGNSGKRKWESETRMGMHTDDLCD